MLIQSFTFYRYRTSSFFDDKYQIVICTAVIMSAIGAESFIMNHGLINFIDTKAKCRHLNKILCRRCLSEFIDWRYSQSCWYFRPSFVNWCPSPLLSGSTLPPLPPLCVNKYTVYTYAVCKGWGMGFWASDRITPAAKSFTSKFF
jgi:hypothetical protein